MGKEPNTTAAERPRPISGGQQEPELAQGPLVAPPVAAHLHRELEEHLDPEEPLEPLPPRRPDPLEHRPALADEDPLLRRLLDEDRRADVEALRALALRGLLPPPPPPPPHLLPPPAA